MQLQSLAFLFLSFFFVSQVFAQDPYSVQSIRPSAQGGLTILSPNGTQYLVNKKDATGVAQIYVGPKGGAPVCITCTDQVNGPKAGLFKMQPHWHPSGKWIFLAVQQENFVRPWYASDSLIEGWLQCGLWTDMWVTTPDGSTWYKLQDFGPTNPSKATGFTGPAITPDGMTFVWAQMVDGNVFAYTFGKWQLIAASFTQVGGVPALTNLRNITPPNTDWVEPGNFSPNGHDLVLTADTGFPNHAAVQGQDQFVLNILTGQITNLTNSPDVWDEHGVFSPDGKTILYMSSAPYPGANQVWFLKTEFMVMNADGSNPRQVTHFNTFRWPQDPEFSWQPSVAANGEWSPDCSGASVQNLFFPNYKVWDITFSGSCSR